MRQAYHRPVPRRKRREPLGPCEVTRHATEAYIRRVDPQASTAAAIHGIRKAAETAHKVAGPRAHHEADIYQADGFRLVVVRPARRLPIVVTVLPPKGARA